jgi:thiamine pyrophosphate-dependent acetolactate synthase large subunit-like protein
MGASVADYVLKRLTEWKVERVFGYPGDGINGFLGAFDRAEGKPEFIQARHEEMAAFMACGHAKFTGDLGVCIATSGPGAVHLLNGLYDAKLDHQPVLALVGQQKRLSLGAHYQQEIDLNTLFKDVSAFVNTCSHPGQARHLIDRGIRCALTDRGVATIIFPEDVQEEEAIESPSRLHGSVYSSIGWTVTSARAASTPASASICARPRGCERIARFSRRRPTWCRRTAGRCRASTATASSAGSCWGACTGPRSSGRFGNSSGSGTPTGR